MASTVDICNGALSLLGQKLITSLNDQTAEALACRVHWKPLRDSTLRGHKWNCVTRRASLNQLLETPDFGFKYYYQLPSKCLYAIELENQDFFEVEGRKLLTDSSEANLIYIEADDDTSIFDAQLTEAFIYLLAAILCPSMTSSSTEAARLQKLGDDKLKDARATDAFEAKRRDKRGNRLIAVKNGRR